jgi:hypothetical protein
MRTLNVAFLVVNEGKNSVEEFLAILAEEFIVGHGGPPIRDGKILCLGIDAAQPTQSPTLTTGQCIMKERPASQKSESG